MDADIDHYLVLGLPSGEQGSRLTEKEITKAYRSKAFELHPDKNLDDPNARANFQNLQTSYQILNDGKGRKRFDDLLRAKQQKHQRELQRDSKRRRMTSVLDERERAASFDTTAKARSEEEIIARKFKEEVDRIRKMCANKMNFNSAEASTPLKKESVSGERSSAVGRANKEAFGEVKYVVIRTKKKKGLPVIVMATKEAAVAATRAVCGDFSNPLLVAAFPTAREPVKSEGPLVNEELVGDRFKAFEDSVLQKLQKVNLVKDGIISEAGIVHFMNQPWCLSNGNWEEWCFSRSETKFGIKSSRTFELSKLVHKMQK